MDSGDLSRISINLDEEREARREIVLSPGPDMVRMHGGPFTIGPTESYKKRVAFDRGAPDSDWPNLKPIEVAAFDIDQTEVTAAQWMKCRQSKGCSTRHDLMGITALPSDENRPYCTAGTVKIRPTIVENQENHPVNCVARWEAEDYCRWAGKRLLTAVEWEYAARSGNDEYEWPWGEETSSCEHGQTVMSWERCGAPRGTAPVCSHPQGNTNQGLCDIIGNVAEHIQSDRTGEPSPDNPHGKNCVGGGWMEHGYTPMFNYSSCANAPHQSANEGFRCARSVPIENSEGDSQ